MKSRLAILITAMALGLTACSSGAPAQSGSATISTLRIGQASTLPSLNPAKTINATSIDNLALEGLLKFDQQGRLQPNLASSWEQTAPTTYVYHLRKDVKFWDGTALTADDVAYSLNFERAPGSQVAFPYASVKYVVAEDPYTVVVTLKRPDATWQYTPAENTALIFQKKFAVAHAKTFGDPGTLIMGSGPWKIDNLDATKGAQLSANPHWWGGKVPIQKVTFTYYASGTSEALAFRSGAIDLAPDVNQPHSFAATSGAKLLTTPGCGISFFSMNTSQAPWSDVHVRRAVAYALNRTDIIAASGGYAAPISTVIPPVLLRSVGSQAQIDTLLKSLPLYPYDPDKAKQELSQSAYPSGFSASILEYNSPDALNISQVIAAELGKIGIHLQIKTLDVVAWQAKVSGPASDRSTLFTSAGCFNPDANAYSDIMGSENTKPGGWNVSLYAPADVEKLLAEGVATTDRAKRWPIYSELVARYQTDVPYVGLYVSDTAIALSSKYTYARFNPWFNHGAYLLNIKRESSS